MPNQPKKMKSSCRVYIGVDPEEDPEKPNRILEFDPDISIVQCCNPSKMCKNCAAKCIHFSNSSLSGELSISGVVLKIASQLCQTATSLYKFQEAHPDEWAKISSEIDNKLTGKTREKLLKFVGRRWQDFEPQGKKDYSEKIQTLEMSNATIDKISR